MYISISKHKHTQTYTTQAHRDTRQFNCQHQFLPKSNTFTDTPKQTEYISYITRKRSETEERSG